ncbi:MAG: cytochrome P450 [Nocardiopsaceae bacterium]|nr:cytochrome P450 [Nocardiopsaceae bacterium]
MVRERTAITAVRFPPGPGTPRLVQGVIAMLAQRRGIPGLRERYGDAFTVNVAGFGRVVVISDPGQVRQVFLAGPGVIENLDDNLGRVFGPGSMFALTGERHRKERKLLVPPFHGRRLAAYERIAAEEADREFASWPSGREFAVMPSMMRITVNVILRAVFGARGQELDALAELLPKAVRLGSVLAAVPIPKTRAKWTPWGRAMALRRDYDAIVDSMIAAAEADPKLDERDDVLALMLQARYDDGSKMANSDIADELLTLLAAGHETTAITLAWAVERLRRNPSVLRDLVAEVDAGGVGPGGAGSGGGELLQAVITEVQRTRPVIDLVGRTVKAESMELGPWILPRGTTIAVSIGLMHENPELFGDPGEFRPSRWMGAKPDLHEWIPFGGGTRRCIGAAFANMEMNVVLRTMLRDFTLEPLPPGTPGERWHFRGIASSPARGGEAIVTRRRERDHD